MNRQVDSLEEGRGKQKAGVCLPTVAAAHHPNVTVGSRRQAPEQRIHPGVRGTRGAAVAADVGDIQVAHTASRAVSCSDSSLKCREGLVDDKSCEGQ